MGLRFSKAATILLIILIATGLAVYFWLDGDTGTSSNSSSEKPTSTKNINATSVENAKEAEIAGESANPPASTYQLPSIEMPIDEAFDQLKLASDKGEAKATCRLALELLKCQLSLQSDEKELEQDVTDINRNASPETQMQMQLFAMEDLRAYRNCRKLKAAQLTDAADLLEHAANQKQLDAMVVWATGKWIKGRYGNSQAYLQDPDFERWRLSAVPMMNDALHRGSYAAARAFGEAYDFDIGPMFNGLIKDDARLNYSFWVLNSLLQGDAPSPPRGLSAQNTLAGETEGRRMFQQWFGGKSFNKDKLSEELISLHTNSEGQRDLCNAGP